MFNRLLGLSVILIFYIVPFQDLVVSLFYNYGMFSTLVLKLMLITKEILIVVFGVCLLFRLRTSALELALIAFLFVCILFVVFSQAPLVQALVGFRTYVLFVFSFCIGSRLASVDGFLQKFHKHITKVFFLITIFSFLEYFIFPDSIWKHPFPVMEMKREVANISTSNEYYSTGMPVNAFGELVRRMIGPFDEPLYMAYFCAILTNFFIASLVYGNKRPTLKAGIGSAMILLTQTRAIIIGIMLSIVAILVKERRIKVNVVLSSIAALALLILSIFVFYDFYRAFFNSIFTAGGRNIGHIEAYISGLNNLKTAPLGRGIGISSTLVTGDSTNAFSTENAFINIALETGILGLTFVLGVFIWLWFRFRKYLIKYKSLHASSGDYIIVASAFLLVTQFIFAGFVAPHILTGRVIIPFMIVLGWAYAQTRKKLAVP